MIDNYPTWTIRMSNLEDPDVTCVTVWIRQPPRGLVSDIEKILEKYIPDSNNGVKDSIGGKGEGNGAI
jgi:hypothetical protein